MSDGSSLEHRLEAAWARERCRRPGRSLPGEMRHAAATIRRYVRRNPLAAALACFGVGFVLAWRLKP